VQTLPDIVASCPCYLARSLPVGKNIDVADQFMFMTVQHNPIDKVEALIHGFAVII
jgi:hypothetical protein